MAQDNERFTQDVDKLNCSRCGGFLCGGFFFLFLWWWGSRPLFCRNSSDSRISARTKFWSGRHTRRPTRLLRCTANSQSRTCTADSLLWGRDLLERSRDGQVDIPRLAEGNVALQVFSLPTKSPRGLNIEHNDDKSDTITLLALVERWPPATWTSLTQRALYQARRLHRFAKGSRGGFVVIESAADLSSYLERRSHNRNLTAGLLSIEGAHALDGKLENLDCALTARAIG